ncbi:MAG: S8 family serine peptidase [Phycisphaerales bacterium]
MMIRTTCMTLVLAAGQALGVTDQSGALESALELSAADRAAIAAAQPIGLDFSRAERPGQVERSGFVQVALKSGEQMLQQISTERAEARRSGLLRGLAEPASAAPALVEARLRGAVARLAPSMVKAFEDVREYRVAVPAGMTEESFGEALMATGDYAWVAPDWICYPADTIPNDAQFGNQYHHGANHLNTVGAWDFVTGSASTLLGVCDTGIDLDHEDLQASIVDGYNSVDRLTISEGGNVNDNNGHGSGATGCAAAIGNNSVGVAGVAWNAGILHAKVSNASGGGAAQSDIKRGARWAADNGATTVSISYSGVDAPGNNVGDQLEQRGAQVFYSSGNDGAQLSEPVDDNIVVVGALGTNGQRVSFSNYGPQLDVMAHGVSVRSTSRTGGYTWFGGTSAAAPLANGVAALVVEANPEITPPILRSILYETATDLGAPGFDDFNGWGRLNAEAAVIAALTGDFSTPLPLIEDFESGALSGALWADVAGAVVNGDAANEPSGVNAMNINQDASATTIRFAADGASDQLGVAMGVQTQGVEAGETLAVEYFDGAAWQTLIDVVSDGVDREEFVWQGARIPAAAISNDLRLRFTGAGDEPDDRWFIDDVRVTDPVAVLAPVRRTFEGPVETSALWSTFEGARTSDDAGTGNFSVRLVGGETVETGAINALLLSSGSAYISVLGKDEGADAGESLLVEAQDSGGVWQTVGELVSDGTPDASFSLIELEMDITLLHSQLKLRISAQGDEPSDSWLIDNVYVGEIAAATGCNEADFTGDGVLNLDDIDAFVAAFLSGDLAADVDGSGSINIDDIDAFVAAFLAGCP